MNEIDSLKGNFISRKKALNSFRRHFSQWKNREFCIDSKSYRLLMSSSSGSKLTEVELLSATITSVDNETKGLILIVTSPLLEILIKFSDEEMRSTWLTHLDFLIKEIIRIRRISYQLCLKSFCRFLLDQVGNVTYPYLLIGIHIHLPCIYRRRRDCTYWRSIGLSNQAKNIRI